MLSWVEHEKSFITSGPERLFLHDTAHIFDKILKLFFHAQLSWASSAELSMKIVLDLWYFYSHD